MRNKVNPDANSSTTFTSLEGITARQSKYYTDGSEEGHVTPMLTVPSSMATGSVPSKTIKLCTMCGRYNGIEMRRSRFIILCIALGLLLIIALIIAIIYAIVPAVVRASINNAQITFRSINVDNVESDRFHLRAESELSNTGSIAATIRSPLTINVNDFGSITKNEPISVAGTTTFSIDSLFQISDLQAFYSFARSIIFDEHILCHLTTKLSVQPVSSAMPVYSNILFDKQIQLNCLNGLRNVKIKSISFQQSDAQRILTDLIIEIENPSLFNIDVGRLTFSLYYSNFSIGFVQSVDSHTILRSQSNLISFSGELQSNSSESFSALSTVVENFLTAKISNIQAIAGANASSYPLLATSMQGLTLNIQMNPFNDQLISQIVFKSLSLIPSTVDRKVLLSAVLDITINSPLGPQSPINISSLYLNLSFAYESNTVGMLNISQTPLTKLNNTIYQLQFSNEYLIIADTGETYEKFAQNFIQADVTSPIRFSLIGFAVINGSFALGPLNISEIIINNNVSLVGLAGLNNVRVHGISVNGETANALRVIINVTINNPGITYLQLKNFTLSMADSTSGTVIGKIPIDVLSLQSGNNNMIFHGLIEALNETSLVDIGKFFSRYLTNKNQSVRLFHGLFNETNLTAEELTISGLSMQVNLLGIETQLIQRLKILTLAIEFDPLIVNRVYITGQLSVLLQLPSNINMTYTVLKTSIDFVLRLSSRPNMGRVILNNIDVQFNQTENKLFISFNKTELFVLNDAAFQEFAAQLVLTNNVSVIIEGLVTALIKIQLGNITLSDIPLNDIVYLTGYNQFANGLLSIDEVDITNALTSNTLSLDIKVKLDNPSIVDILNGGRLSLNLWESTNKTSLGLVVIDPFYLGTQISSTHLNASGTFLRTSVNSAVVQQFISRMVSGIDNIVELRGLLPDTSIGTSIPLLSTAIAGLNTRAEVPGLSGTRALVLQINLKKLTLFQISGIPLGLVTSLIARIRLKNPFSTPIAITGMQIRADYSPVVDQTREVGMVIDNTYILIGARQEIVTSNKVVYLTGRLSTLIALLTPLLAGPIGLSLSGFINVTIGYQFILYKLPVTFLNVTTVEDATIV